MEKTLRQNSSDCIRICLFGPESSGKSTLSQKLSHHYNAPLVKEFARSYLQKIWDTHRVVCRPKDLLPIAAGQMASENSALLEASNLLICDTDLLTTKVYSEAYYQGWSPELLKKIALENTYDLYLLTDIDIPWVNDDLRDRPYRREEMFALFEEALLKNERPYILVTGSLEERVHKAVTSINKLLK